MKYQEDEIETYCKENGWNLIHIFRDEGISGAKFTFTYENDKAMVINKVILEKVRFFTCMWFIKLRLPKERFGRFAEETKK